MLRNLGHAPLSPSLLGRATDEPEVKQLFPRYS